MSVRIVRLILFINLMTLLPGCQKTETKDHINTVNATIDASKLGLTLTHEHIMSNFGKDMSVASNYDSIKLFNQVIPYLKKLKSLGVHSIFDCTTAYFGRRVDLLGMISDSTGVQIITNTGFYGAANDRHVPEFAFNTNAQTIADIWIEEFKNGIEGTKIKPGFIKLAFDSGPPSAIDKKLFEAGVLTHLNTGLTLAVHTTNNIEAAKFQARLLNQYNVSLDAWVWIHANQVEDNDVLIDFASKGAWISLDNVSDPNTEEYINRIKLFKEKNLLNKVLLSHDGNGFPGGGKIRKFEALVLNLIPALLRNGFTQDEIDQLTISNPRKAFSIGIRNKKSQ